MKFDFGRLILLLLLGTAVSNGQSTVRADLRPAGERRPAPLFQLKTASGKTIKLENYRGKLVLLDFWATWCHGCKEEIPWFSELQKKYGSKGFAVVGISLDDDGWNALRPFLAEHKPGYTMLLGDKLTGQRYGIEMLPDTFLIDRQGRIAAAYVGLVDRENLDTNVRALLAQR